MKTVGVSQSICGVRHAFYFYVISWRIVWMPIFICKTYGGQLMNESVFYTSPEQSATNPRPNREGWLDWCRREQNKEPEIGSRGRRHLLRLHYHGKYILVGRNSPQAYAAFFFIYLVKIHDCIKHPLNNTIYYTRVSGKFRRFWLAYFKRS